MDFLTLGFLAIIIAVSGAIAFAADNLGRKIGKKRITFRGMRPKHFATLSVVLTGILTSLATILLVGIFSSDVRAWLLYGRQAIGKVQYLETDLSNLQKQTDDLVLRNQKLSTQARSSENYLRRLEDNIKQQQREFQRQSEEVRRLSGSVKANLARISGLNQKLTANRRELAASLTTKRKLEDESRRLRLANANAISQYNEVNTRNSELTDENGRLETNLRNVQKDIDRLNRETSDLIKQKDDATDQLAKAQSQLQDAEGDLQRLNAELSQVRADYRLATAFNQTLSSTFNSARKQQVTYRMGEEIARLSVGARLSRADAEAAVNSFLTISRTLASSRGAMSSGQFAAAGFVDHEDAALQRPITAAEIRNSLIEQLTNTPYEQVLVGFSSLNAFKGEPVSIEPAVFPNPIIYHGGQVLAETRIDGTTTPGQIYSQIERLLRTQVSERAKQDKMIPRSGTDQPFGTVNPEDIFNLIDKIREADRKVTVRAEAEDTIRAGDLLQLRFSVR